MTKPLPPPPSGDTTESGGVQTSDYNLLEYVEIDVTRCQNVYGSAPCQASLPFESECTLTYGSWEDLIGYTFTGYDSTEAGSLSPSTIGGLTILALYSVDRTVDVFVELIASGEVDQGAFTEFSCSLGIFTSSSATFTASGGESKWVWTTGKSPFPSSGSETVTFSMPGTGSHKCYNSPATCQDPANYTAGTKTCRFAVPTGDLPVDIDARPNIKSISVRAQEVRPGESLGTRESVKVDFLNHRDSDGGYDPYISDRDFSPYNRGTHWGKFVARWPNLQGYPLRVIRGALGQSIEDMETRHYFIESTSGPDINGNFSITAKDALKFLDGKKAQAPLPSNGRLLSAITDTATSLTLTPAGIGNAEYPASGLASIGDEVVEFTRTGDTVTLTSRGARGTEADDHDEDETFQVALVYDGVDPSVIIDDLIFNYTDTPSAYRNAALWLTETETFYGRLLSAEIAKPTAVRDLVSELIEQVGLDVHTDVVNQKIILRILRHGISSLAMTDDNHIAGSLRFKYDEEKRINAVYTYYGLKNPLEDLDEHKNYGAIVALYDDDQVKALESLPLSIKTIRSRWITIFNRPAAEQINQAIIGRYGDTPGMCSFRLPFNRRVGLGDTITVQSRLFEDATGLEKAAQSAIVTSVNRRQTDYEVQAQLFNFRKSDYAPGSGVRTILIDADTADFNLRAVHDSIYTEVEAGNEVNVIIASGVVVYASTTTSYAFSVGEWPDGVVITIENNGHIVGRGGRGGGGINSQFIYSGSEGQDGGPAFYTRYPIAIDNTSGVIGGGGGGGGGGGTTFYLGRGGSGGGGAAYGAGGTAGFGDSYSQGDSGTVEGGGDGAASPTGAGSGGDGGDLGQAGEDGQQIIADWHSGPGGQPGNAVDGDSYITWSAIGDIRGNQVN